MSAEKNKHKVNVLSPVFSVFSSLSFRTKLIILAVIAVAFSFAFPIISNIAGKTFGNTVGAAVGSFQAVTVDMPEAYNQGKEDGLSATDTQTELRGRLQEIGKLDVLAANAKIHNVNKVGDKYAALYEFGADVIFSVDLSKAQVLTGDGSIEIRLPKPVVEINIDSTRTKLVAVRQRGWFNGTTEDGLTEYLNSINQLQDNAQETLENYDWLENRAEQSAREQVVMLTRFVAEKGSKIEVRFEETAGDNQ